MATTTKRAAVLAAAFALAACTPALDWRDARPAGAGLTLLFPCRPQARERLVRVESVELRWQMLSCDAAGATFALAYAQVGDVALVTPTLAALRRSAVANLDAAATSRSTPVAVQHATANVEAVRLSASGRLPDGRPVVEEALFFVKGPMLYQATVIGATLSADATEPFFDALRLAPCVAADCR